MDSLRELARRHRQLRPWWMQCLLGFCLYMTFVYMPFDLFLKPVAEDEDVIVIEAERPRGSVFVDVEPEEVLDARDITEAGEVVITALIDDQL